MIITFNLKPLSKTGNLGCDLKLREKKLGLLAMFMEIEPVNPKLRRDHIAKDLGYSSSTLQRYRQDLKMLSFYRIRAKRYKRKQKIPNTSLDDNSHREHDLRRPQLTSKDLRGPQMIEFTKLVSTVTRTTNKKKQIEKWISA